jgi:hypothetical protein
MFVMACLAVGGLIALFSTNSRVDFSSLMPWSQRLGGDLDEGAVAGMTRSQLEREIARLRAKLAESERENADLIVQMKLLDEGSRTGQ